MRAAKRLGNDAVYEAQFLHVGTGQFQCFCRFHLVVPVAPENGRTGLRTDDGVPRVLQHQHAVTDADAQGTSGSPFADDNADDWYAQLAHFNQVAGNGLALSALLSLQPGKGPRGVDQGHDGAVEFLRQFHEAQGLAVAFGVGHAEVSVLAHLRVDAFLLADEHDALAVNESKSTHHRLVVLHRSVSVELHEVAFGERFDVVQGIRTIRVTADLNALPRRQVGIHLLGDFADFAFQILRERLHVHVALFLQVACLRKLFPQLTNRLFKFQVIHAWKVLQEQRCNNFLSRKHPESLAC